MRYCLKVLSRVTPSTCKCASLVAILVVLLGFLKFKLPRLTSPSVCFMSLSAQNASWAPCCTLFQVGAALPSRRAPTTWPALPESGLILGCPGPSPSLLFPNFSPRKSLNRRTFLAQACLSTSGHVGADAGSAWCMEPPSPGTFQEATCSSSACAAMSLTWAWKRSLPFLRPVFGCPGNRCSRVWGTESPSSLLNHSVRLVLLTR